MPTTLIPEILKKSELLLDRAAIGQVIARMADEIASDYPVQPFAEASVPDKVPLFITIMHGGLLFAAQLSLELGARGIDLQFDYLHATRYCGLNSSCELIWKHRPDTPLFNRDIILVDDILDEGPTLRDVRAWCLEQGASNVRIAALLVKDHNRRDPQLRADYVGITVPDRYVFGFGMDYYEQGRNLPNIYALKE
ncbi:MAG: hypoxanthine-guanine phosphoribosyltransferase [Xanthomonadaceae bacterium]|jgi:hypoxanthine phosphoribosyltransferase|nr:hypoxanthine-guanine phosphoribosyltransferase [Xanthomonadaceae bacterium]